MTFRCARCDWRGEDDEAAAEHARETEHWRCVVCQRRSLTEFERQTCADCVGSLRADLADIVQAFAELEPVTVEALTLLGFGTMQRHARPDELASLHPQPHPLAREGDRPPQPIRDEWTSDPLPVLPLLVSWEDYIREHYGDDKGQPDPTLTEVVDYLTVNLDSRHDLAQTFPAFDELAVAVRHLRSTIQHAAGLANDPEEANTDCLDCGGALVRHYRDVTRDLTKDPQGRDREGREDNWACRACRRVYSPAEYVLAVRAKLEEAS